MGDIISLYYKIPQERVSLISPIPIIHCINTYAEYLASRILVISYNISDQETMKYMEKNVF